MSDTFRRGPGRPPNPRPASDEPAGALQDYAAAGAVSVADSGLSAGMERMARMRAEQESAAEPADDGRPTRASRKPFGTMDQKLYWPKREGFHRHWFNDEPGRVEQALAAGYAHVKGSNGEPVSRVVGKTSEGKGLRGYLMEIPEDWFAEDMARGQQVVDKTAQDIHRGAAGPLGEKHRYIPSQGISIRDTSR